jgi:hypothetical protein
MKPELEQKLYADFPTVFLPRERAAGGDPFRWFGFECSDGWEPIIRDAAAKLAALSPHIHAAQVKEKFGAMRFYLTFDEDKVTPEIRNGAYAITNAAEHASCSVCENCGDPGTIGGNGWISCLCPPCRAKGRQNRE